MDPMALDESTRVDSRVDCRVDFLSDWFGSRPVDTENTSGVENTCRCKRIKVQDATDVWNIYIYTHTNIPIPASSSSGAV